jgi:hypothetical protein
LIELDTPLLFPLSVAIRKSPFGSSEHDRREPLAEAREEGGKAVVEESLVFGDVDLRDPPRESELKRDAEDRTQKRSIEP